MNIKTIHRPVLSIVIYILLASVYAEFQPAFGQDGDTVTVKDGNTVTVRPLTIIPEATETCTPEECAWWDRIRQTNSEHNLAFQKRNERLKRTLKERFVLLIYEGREKGYRVPLEDRPPIPLFTSSPSYPYVARKNRVQGRVGLSVEIGDDGFVTSVKVTNEIGWGLDEAALQAHRQAIYLPAVRDGRFVSFNSDASVEFKLGCIVTGVNINTVGCSK